MAGATEGVILNPMVENAHVALTEKLVGKTKWNFSEVLQFIREQMGIRTNGTLGPDSLTLKLKMEPHLFASVLYTVDISAMLLPLIVVECRNWPVTLP